MKKLYVTEEEWEKAARKYYKFLKGDSVVLPDWITGTFYEGVVKHFYTTDQFNHEAAPHQRYVVMLDNNIEVDVCGSEIMTHKEWRKNVES